MRKTRTAGYVPINLDRLFPHEDHPAYRRLADVQRELGVIGTDARAQRSVRRLLEPIGRASERLVDACSGGMTIDRWLEQIERALEQCTLVRSRLPELAALLPEEAARTARLDDLMNEVIQALGDDWLRAQVSPEAAAVMAAIETDARRDPH